MFLMTCSPEHFWQKFQNTVFFLLQKKTEPKRALSAFRKNCKYDLFTTGDDNTRTFSVDIPEADLTEISDIVSEGMVSQWLKPYVNKQENLENVLNTKDFSTYSPAELLLRVGNAYAKVQKDYTNMIREYSYNHGDLSDLHL